MSYNFLNDFLQDLRVELMDEFDRNFERKAFFTEKWPAEKFQNRRGSLLIRTGALRRSLRGTVRGHSIFFYSSLPYASIQNEGGTIKVTAKMQKYFWAMYYKASGAVTYSVKSKKAADTKRNQRLNLEAAMWKAMALKKIGSSIKIEKRQFIGPHAEVDRCVGRVLDNTMKQVNEHIYKELKQ